MSKKRVDSEEFLDFLLRNVPVAEPPPYFAPRVAALAREQAPDFMLLMNRLARWLLPAFATLGVVVVLISYQVSAPTPAATYPEFLLDQEPFEQAVTTEYVLDSLQPQYPVD